MMIVVFRSWLAPEAGEDYGAMAEAMITRARSMPGFVDFKHFRADDGERLSLIAWEDEETMRRWAADPHHLEAQRLGRERWYREYTIDVAQLVRSNSFRR